MNVDLPTPGTPVMPTRRPRRPVEPEPRISAPACSRWSARLDSTSVIARPRCARDPARTASASAATSTGFGTRPSLGVGGLGSGEPLPQVAEQLDRRVGDHGAGREDRRGAGGAQRVEVLGGITPPTTIMMSSRPRAASSPRSAGTSVRWPAASDDAPTTCTSASTACARDLGRASGTAGRRRRRSRGRRTPWRSPSGRGRGRPGPSWRRGCAGGARASAANSLDELAGAQRRSRRCRRPRCGTRPGSYGSARCAGRTPSPAPLISPTVAWARAASTASCEQVLVEAGPRVPSSAAAVASGASAPPGGGLVALGAQPLELGELLARAPRCCRP